MALNTSAYIFAHPRMLMWLVSTAPFVADTTHVTSGLVFHLEPSRALCWLENSICSQVPQGSAGSGPDRTIERKTAASRWCMYRNVAERARIDVMSHMLDEPFAQALLVQKAGSRVEGLTWWKVQY